MKTFYTTATQSKNHTLMRVAMVILGIVTAIIGTLSDVQVIKNGENVTGILSTTKVAVADFSIQMTNAVASALWPF